MAISFAHVSIHSRSKGHSAIAAAAYRAGIKIYDERLGKSYDYTNRKDVKFTEILLPEGTDSKFMLREFLWNEAERAENRKNSQVSKDFVLALPKELDLIHQIELTKRFAQVHFIDNDVPADIAIHDHGDGNPHAHILVTTRRIKGDRFDTHKARDLNPVFGRGYIKEEDHWNDQWRSFQNHYFEEKGLDLSVDLDHVIPEKHHGGHHNNANHYIREENEIIKEARQEIALNDIENFINILSIEHSVFTKRDIELLLFKTLKEEHYNEFFQVTVERVLTNKNVIFLGENEYGHKSFTTKNHFKQEGKLLKSIERLDDRKGHIYQGAIRKYLAKKALNEEQKQAFDFIVNGHDISCIIGRPGVGKSYMLKPIKEFYQSQNCRVIGASLSGKVAKQLKNETGIASSTIASLSARIISESLKLNENDIVIIDEAGMVDFSNMSFLVDEVRKAKAKLILVGDPSQLKPIKKGSIFRGIANHVGCFTMTDIQRQRNEYDRQASIDLACGHIVKGLEHYKNKDALVICDNKKGVDASDSLIRAWDDYIGELSDVSDNVILAHANSTIEHLNLEARQKLIYKSIIDFERFTYIKEFKNNGPELKAGELVVITHTDKVLGLIGGEQARIIDIDKEKNHLIVTNDGKMVRVPSHLRRYIKPTGLKQIVLAKNERIIFKKNDRDIGVKNGDIGTIESINEKNFIAKLDSGELVNVPKRFKHLDYAYAMTVHKAQGMSSKNVFVCIDTKWWDRMLSFVAFTRHKENLKAFANTSNFDNFDDLTKKLSRRSLSDNVIDYPFNLGLRHGFDFNGLLERAVSRITGAKQMIQDKTNYLYNYTKAQSQMRNAAFIRDEKLIKENAKQISKYLDMKSNIKSQHHSLTLRAERLNMDISDLDGFDSFYKLTIARDKKASSILQFDPNLLNALELKGFDKDVLKFEQVRHEELNVIKSIMKLHSIKDVSFESHVDLCRKISAIDTDNKVNKIIINQLAKQQGVDAKDIQEAIKPFQEYYRKQVWKKLATQYPALIEYKKLSQLRKDAQTNFEKEKMDKRMTEISRKIASNEKLSAIIKTYLPKLKNSLNQSIQRGIEKDRGVER